jgi:hypothetical protein
LLVCADCENKLRRSERKALQGERRDQARHRGEERRREMEVARKVDEWRRAA